MKNRLYNMLYAKYNHYFWLPCPSCGNKFGGHEWRTDLFHENSIPTELTHGGSRATGICPDCARDGVGDRAWAEAYKEFEESGLDIWTTSRTDLF